MDAQHLGDTMEVFFQMEFNMSERLVEFDDVTCCALTIAFLRNKTLIRDWSATIGRFHIFYEILARTIRLAFIPNVQAAAVYRSFARAECARIEHNMRSPRFLCRHAADQHLAALNTLLTRLPRPN